jgi:hypothetical protein
MQKTNFFLSLILFACIIAFFSCKKTDNLDNHIPPDETSIEGKFFNTSRFRSNTEDKLVAYLKRVNVNLKFVVPTV